MPVEQLAPTSPLWPALIDHLRRVNMVRWAVTDAGLPRPNLIFLAAVEGLAIVGHLTLEPRSILIPALTEPPTPLLGLDGQPLHETFVQTFAVDESHRRRGYGRALQIAGLDVTRELGCYQMRSWSSVDKPANYALKISLGFAAHPAYQDLPSGRRICGVYFVKTV